MIKQNSELFSGETVAPQKVDSVSMLFSDLVGFTAICSTATPLQVITMLNTLYTEFDSCCGWLDVYKVSTLLSTPSCTPVMHSTLPYTITIMLHQSYTTLHHTLFALLL